MAVGIGFAFLLLSWRFAGPAYLEDEIGYLANAAFFAGHRIDAASSYHAGYSLFLAPAFWLSDPHLVWKGVLAINAVLWAASFVVLHSILRRLLPTASESNLLTATAVSALYPTWAVSTGYAFATVTFVLVFLASVLALFLWSPKRLFSLLPHSVLTGFLYWVHPTGAAVVLASLLVIALDAYRRRDVRPLCMHVIVIAALATAYLGIHAWMAGAMTPPGYTPNSHYPSLRSALRAIVTWNGFAVFVTVLVGQLAYFVVASFGMAAAGMMFCAHQIMNASNHAVRGRPPDSDPRLIYCYLCAAPLCIMALGALSFFQWDRFEGDFWIYGRYADAAILPLLAIGLAMFQPDIRFAALPIALLVAGLLLAVMAPADAAHNIVNTVSFWPQYVARNAGFFVWMLCGAIAVAGVAWVGRKLAIVLMAIAFPLSIYHQTAWHQWILADFSAPSSLIKIIRGNVPARSCVGFNPALPADATLFQRERYHLNSFYLFNYAYRRMSPAEWLAQCDGPYLTYDASDLVSSEVAQVVAREIKSNLLLVKRANQPPIKIPADIAADVEVAAGR